MSVFEIQAVGGYVNALGVAKQRRRVPCHIANTATTGTYGRNLDFGNEAGASQFGHTGAPPPGGTTIAV